MPHPPELAQRGERRAGDGRRPASTGSPQLMEHFMAGQLASLRELTLLYAPNINSYKRFVAGSFAPTAVAWGRDNRTCALRVVGPRRLAARGEPGTRRRRQPVPRPRRDDRGGPGRHRPAPAAGAGVHRRCLRGAARTRPRLAARCGRLSGVRGQSIPIRAARRIPVHRRGRRQSLASQGQHRIERRGPPRRDVARQQRNPSQ